MIQKEHILGGLIAIIVITGVQIATQMQMLKITKQVEMVQENLSAKVIASLDEEKITEQEDSFTRDELIEIEKMFEIASSNFVDTPDMQISLWNRIRRKICRDTGGTWTGAPASDCDWPKALNQGSPVVQE
jgi:hypothetical protein